MGWISDGAVTNRSHSDDKIENAEHVPSRDDDRAAAP
jgi:hypothetical protein